MPTTTAAPEEKAPAEAADSSPQKKASTLLSAHVFECYSPPPINTFQGHVVPRMFSKYRRRRKVSVEVHQIEHTSATSQKRHYVEECIVRVLDPTTKQEQVASKLRAKMRRLQAGEGEHHADHDEEDDHADDNDDASTASSTVTAKEFQVKTRYTTPEFDKGWHAKYTIPLRAISIKGTHKTGVLLQVTSGDTKQVRELIFDTMADADKFQSALRQEMEKESLRAVKKAEAVLGNGGATAPNFRVEERITFLIEIVSGWDIPAGDFSTSDPYVLFSVDGREVHRTKYVPKTLDPIWTLKTDSLFLFETSAKDLFITEGLVCTLYDFDNLGKDEKLGRIYVSPKTLYEAKGERMEFKLLPCTGGTEEVPGYLAIRCRRATDHDISFMKEYKSSTTATFMKKKPGFMHALNKEAEGVTGRGNIASMMNKRSKIEKHGRNFGKKVYKIRPGPDPTRKEETTWMTKEELLEESLKPSVNWVDAGTGSLARIFVEIIGCDDLPNLDVGGFAGNKTDTFVALVYQDAVLRTDVIDDTLSPRWMPWSQRAFVLHMMHSSSQLFLGVFDYDAGINPTDDHDLIGRVSVDISNLRRDTVYTLKYNICTTAKMSAREQVANITIRLRLEIPDERKVVLSNLEPPPEIFVSSKNRRDFRVMRYTCTGKYDMDKYSMKIINSFIEELLALQHSLFYVQDAIIAVLLWRGTVPIPFLGTKGKPLKLPLHSIVAFLFATFLVEYPQLIPSFCFASLAWLMLALNGYNSNIPDVWSRTKSFREFVEMLVFGASLQPPDSIDAYENHEEAKAYLDSWKKRITDSEEQAAKAYEESLKQQEEYEREIEEIGDDTDITTKQGGISVDPFKPILFPLQQNLAVVCRYVRHVKYIAGWEECYISFWVTVGCLLLSFVFFFVPWFFLIKWTSRLIVWTLFGPWMKLVDIYYWSKIENMDKTKIEERKALERLERLANMRVALSAARVKRENAMKLKAMKKFLFGKFIIRVPALKEDRYQDLPLPESTAVPFNLVPRPLSELAMEDIGYHKTRIPGQHLVGDMIPEIESLGFSEVPVGQPTAQPRMLQTGGSGGASNAMSDSDAAAYATIASVVVSAGILTSMGVPLLTEAIMYVLKAK